jgi:hypothetical protein
MYDDEKGKINSENEQMDDDVFQKEESENIVENDNENGVMQEVQMSEEVKDSTENADDNDVTNESARDTYYTEIVKEKRLKRSPLLKNLLLYVLS